MRLSTILEGPAPSSSVSPAAQPKFAAALTIGDDRLTIGDDRLTIGDDRLTIGDDRRRLETIGSQSQARVRICHRYQGSRGPAERQKDALPPRWTRVDDPRPCATAIFSRRNAAENHSDPP